MDDTEILKNQVEHAPEQIKKYLRSEEWDRVVSDIALKDTLRIDQKTALQNEVLFVLLGMEISNDFKTNVESSLEIESILAEAITAEMNERVFKPLADFLPKNIEESETNSPATIISTTTSLEIPPNNLPIEEIYVPQPAQNTAHTTPVTIPRSIVEEKLAQPTTAVSPASYSGTDPYREPLE